MRTRRPLFIGCGTALATPFDANGVDVKALTELVHWQIEQGVSALIACGTTGEPSCMTDAEWAQVIATVVKAAEGLVPVIAGTGGNNTLHVIEQAKKAQDLGASAQLCVTPYYNKTTQQGLIAHYSAIADATDLPIILYNVPSRTGLHMQPDTVVQLSQHPHISALKEAGGDFTHIGDVFLKASPGFAIYSGADEHILPLMSLGGLGVISVLSNIMPRYVSDLCALALKGDYREASRMQLEALPLIHQLFSEVSPGPLKYAMELLNLCENRLRLPLLPLSDAKRPMMEAAMRERGLLS